MRDVSLRVAPADLNLSNTRVVRQATMQKAVSLGPCVSVGSIACPRPQQSTASLRATPKTIEGFECTPSASQLCRREAVGRKPAPAFFLSSTIIMMMREVKQTEKKNQNRK